MLSRHRATQPRGSANAAGILAAALVLPLFDGLELAGGAFTRRKKVVKPTRHRNRTSDGSEPCELMRKHYFGNFHGCGWAARDGHGGSGWGNSDVDCDG